MPSSKTTAIVGATLVAAGLVSAAAGGGVFASGEGQPSAHVAQYTPPSAPGSTVTTGSSTTSSMSSFSTTPPGRGSSSPAHSATGTTSPSTPTPTPAAPVGYTAGTTTTNPQGAPARVYVFNRSGKTIVNASLVPSYLDAHSVLAPPPGVAGWYAERGWVQPGRRGTSVLVGHVTWNGVPDTFYNLPQVTPGDKILVRYSSGDQVAFIATGSRGESKDAVPKDRSIWDPTSGPSLRLITCDPKTPMRGGHFEGNWVVWARPA